MAHPEQGFRVDEAYEEIRDRYYTSREKDIIAHRSNKPTKKELQDLMLRAQRLPDSKTYQALLISYSDILFKKR